MTDRTAAPVTRLGAVSDDDLSTQVLRQFRIVFSEVRGHFQQIEKASGIGGAQMWALSLVGREAGLGVTELAQHMHVHQSTASNLVRQLLRRGLIRSEKSTVDKRSVQLHLLPAGQALLERTPGPHEGVLPHALRQQSERHLKAMQRSLAALIETLQAGDEAGEVLLADM